MKEQKRRKTIQYKRAALTSNHITLQTLISEALKPEGRAAKAKSRREIINPDDESCRLINHHKEYSGMLFGQLVFFEAGRSQALITLDDDAEFYEINSFTPDSLTAGSEDKEEIEARKVRKRQEFVDSMLYFGVLDDHVVIMQSAALKARELETHLAWLLGTCAELMDKNSALILQDKPTEETLRKVEKTPVKSVHLGAPVETKEEQEQAALGEQENGGTITTEDKAKKVKFVPYGMGVDVIRAALGTDWFDRFQLEESLDEANLQVSLEISYIRKTTRHGQKMLDNIATTLRHTEASDVRVDLYGGGTIKGNDLKLSGHVSVKTLNGLVDENDLYHQMHAWLVTKIQSNEIEVDEAGSD